MSRSSISDRRAASYGQLTVPSARICGAQTKVLVANPLGRRIVQRIPERSINRSISAWKPLIGSSWRSRSSRTLNDDKYNSAAVRRDQLKHRDGGLGGQKRPHQENRLNFSRERRLDRVRLGEIPAHDIDPLRQAGALRAAGQGADSGATTKQLEHHIATDIAGRPGNQDHAHSRRPGCSDMALTVKGQPRLKSRPTSRIVRSMDDWHADGLSVGQVAGRMGITPSAVRWYDDHGLLPSERTSANRIASPPESED
jgi:hypothetical protein